jgi:hypothetical protein
MSGLDRTAHPRVVQWLDNFPARQRDTATLLVAGLKLVSETDLRRELGDLVSSLLQSLPSPVAAFPSREVVEGQPAHQPGREGDYLIFDPGLPGSEAVVGNILTGIQRRPQSKGLMLDHFDLKTMRDAKARSVLLVDDFSGSGKRLLDFERGLRRHPTIRSWASSRHITFHAVVYSATARAANLLRRRFGADRVHIVRPCPTFVTAGWSPEQLADVEALCLEKAGRKRKGMALGFRSSRALIAFEHTAPNNLPYVLWRTAEKWNAFFEGKAVPNDLLRLFTMAPVPPREPLAGTEGARRLGRLIDLLGHRVRNVDTIAETIDISLEEAGRLLKLVQDLGMAGPTFRLTDRGLTELRRWRAAHAIRELPNRSDPYYPLQLRAGR